MMRRRTFLAFGALALLAPRFATAQQPIRPRLVSFPPNLPGRLDIFRAAMRERGYVEDIDYAVQVRVTDELGAFQQAVGAGVSVILTPNSPSARFAAQATGSIPIVAAILQGEAAPELIGPNFAQPRANVTGIGGTIAVNPKIFEVASELVAGARTIGLLSGPSQQAVLLSSAEEAARAMGFRFISVVIEGKSGLADELGLAFETFGRETVNVVVAHNGSLGATTIFTNAEALAHVLALSGRRQMPVLHTQRELVEIGALIGYGRDPRDNYVRAAYFVDRIFRGAKVADLPFEQDTEFRLAVNLKTARAQGFEIPAQMLARADQVIE